MTKIKNIDNIKSEDTKQFLIEWNERVSRVTITDDGLYMLDLIPLPPLPPFSGATLIYSNDKD